MHERMIFKPFRYCGNKTRLLKFYRRPLSNVTRIVEPYMGGGSYGLSTDLPCLGYDTNGDVVELWHWLKRQTPESMRALKEKFEAFKTNSKCTKPDVRDMGLESGAQTYVRINTTGVITGQLMTWKLYPQHSLPVEKTIACLDKIKTVEVVHGPASLYKHKDGDLLFIDPPYVGTTAGYIEKGVANHELSYDPRETIELISKTSNPVIFTYGDCARDIFPDYDWQIVTTRKVPNVRKGGTVDRREWVCYVNW